MFLLFSFLVLSIIKVSVVYLFQSDDHSNSCNFAVKETADLNCGEEEVQSASHFDSLESTAPQ